MKSFVCLFWIICSPLAIPALADEASETVFSAPTVRIPLSASPQTQAATAKRSSTLDRSARPLVIDLGPLPSENQDDLILKRQRKRRQIGIHRPLPREFRGNLVPHLDWTIGADGHLTGEITFRAAGAISLRISVQATLPSGASVQIFDGEGHPRGSYSTQADFNASGNAPVWLSSADGDTLIAQIVLPSAESLETLSFNVMSVAHRFASAKIHETACLEYVDLPCAGSQAAYDIADAVARIVFEDAGGSFLCTGTLLNTHIPDGVPPPEFQHQAYFLTANHCVATPAVAASVTAYFFYRRTTCSEDSELDPRYENSWIIESAELIVTSSAQDSTLLSFGELRNPTPGVPSWHELPREVNLAGWTNREVRPATAVVSVHHPLVWNGPHESDGPSTWEEFAHATSARYSEGRVRRTLARVDITDDFGEEVFPVYNAIETDWSRGLTGHGSSGAGLFTTIGTSEHLVGVLSGGEGECSTEGDIFGSFRDFFPLVKRWLVAGEPESFTHMLPAVPGANVEIQGFVRIINESNSSSRVEIYAIDDAGQRYGPVTLALDANQTRHFNSTDLEHGAPSKGLIGGVGDGTGMWRLELKTTLNIEPRAYIRTPDGFVTSMHQVAEVSADTRHQYQVPFFNPASNTAIRSLLRVINPNLSPVYVTIVATDDDANPGLQPVQFPMFANTAIQISSQSIEQGDSRFYGAIGDGNGKWQLVITGTEPLHVMSLLSTPSGHLTNLSR